MNGIDFCITETFDFDLFISIDSVSLYFMLLNQIHLNVALGPTNYNSLYS